MNLISLDGVSKTLADAPLFEEVTLGIDAGERIGFVGRNGSGKSTFLKILHGELEPDSGSISRNRELRLSAVERGAATIDHNLIQGFAETEGEILGEAAVLGDPLFVDAAHADFHLRRGSPAIGVGSAEGAPPKDFDGRTRRVTKSGSGVNGAGPGSGPTAAACSIGAFEM
jgi:energy-coupling factor transporter ATP-binding protein EcfA2